MTVIPFPVKSEAARGERRAWERVNLRETNSYASVGSLRINIIDLGYGGLALETSSPEILGDVFQVDLHVPLLGAVPAKLQRMYSKREESGMTRIGCRYVS